MIFVLSLLILRVCQRGYYSQKTNKRAGVYEKSQIKCHHTGIVEESEISHSYLGGCGGELGVGWEKGPDI